MSGTAFCNHDLNRGDAAAGGAWGVGGGYLSTAPSMGWADLIAWACEPQQRAESDVRWVCGGWPRRQGRLGGCYAQAFCTRVYAYVYTFVYTHVCTLDHT